MKKVLIALSLPFLLSFGISVSAALPQEGVYLNKDGSPVTEDQKTAPSIKSAKMLPQSQAVHDALASLPHSSSTVLLLTINEDGTVTHEEITQSSSSIILDQYAASSAESWTFRPAALAGRAIASTVTIPVRFVSALVAIPATPSNQIMKDMNEKQNAAALSAGHPVIPVKVHISAAGKMEGKPSAQKEGLSLSEENYKILSSYVEDCVRGWTFTAAQNPDGEPIESDLVIPVQV